MHVPASTQRTVPIEDLRRAVRGGVIAPGDPDYDASRAIFNGGIDAHPGAIVRAADAVDVARVVSFAREAGVELAIRGGGHSPAGHGTSDGGIVVEVADLRGLEIDADAETAWAGAGHTAGELTKELAAHDLAVGFGDTGSVGISGITLGGGVGYLSRKYGLTIDSLLAVELVTADGRIRTVDAESEPDLFWALRGGGGNFGVATRFRFRLQHLGQIVGGMLMLPATAQVVAGFIAAADAAPEELGAIANVMPVPPMPFIPPGHQGELVVMALVCYTGDPADGASVLAPFRSLAKPIVDMVRPIRYPEMYPPDDPSYRPAAVNRTLFVDRIDEATAGRIVDRIRSSDATFRLAQLRVLGGAVARVPADATAYAHRASRIMVNLTSFYDGSDDRKVRQAWLDEFATAIHQGDEGAYVNFLGDEGPERVRAAYPGGTWDRLVAIKSRYDPTNLFSRNQNIPPA